MRGWEQETRDGRWEVKNKKLGMKGWEQGTRNKKWEMKNWE